MRISEASISPDGVTLAFNVPTCNGDPEATITETDDEVQLEVVSYVPGPFTGGDDCLDVDVAAIKLDGQLASRPVIDAASGDTIAVIKTDRTDIIVRD